MKSLTLKISEISFTLNLSVGCDSVDKKKQIKCYETLHNDLCMLRPENYRQADSNDFTESELESVIHGLKKLKVKGHFGLCQGYLQTKWQSLFLCLGNDKLHQDVQGIPRELESNDSTDNNEKAEWINETLE